MRIDVITLFPKILEGALGTSILGRALQEGIAQVQLHQLRDYTHDKHRTVDDRPYGGGPGMVMKCEPINGAVKAVRAMAEPTGIVVVMSASGRRFDQATAQHFSEQDRLIMLTGHYEGIDQRVVDELQAEEISIGDYVLTNGALAALVVIDSVVRLLPEALGNDISSDLESFSERFPGRLEAPQFTRPEEWQSRKVPEVLLSGHHAEIEKWRDEESLRRTRANRPDLLRVNEQR